MERARKQKFLKRAGVGAPTPVAAAVRDSFANFEARVGIGTGNQSAGGSYEFSFISRNRVQIEAAYRTSWIVGQAVDAVAEDMTRAGVEIQSTLKPEDIERMYTAIGKLAIWKSIEETIKWARLYGGAIAYLMIDGQKSETPLNLDSIGKDSFKGLLVLDRWLVQPSLTDLIDDLGPGIGMPKYYDVVADAQGMTRRRIHHSRVVRLDGVDLPYWQRIAENGWGQSVLERLWDRLLAFDSTTQGAAQLVYKAYLRTYSVEGLREIIATGGKAFEGLVKQIEMIRTYQTNEGMTLMDSKDTMEAHQYTFAGLSDVLMQFAQQLSGALQIPLVRLFGQSPAGLNATGESDIRLYYDHIAQQQESRLRAPMAKILDVLHRSEFEQAPPEGFSFEFNPLWQLSDKEKAEVSEIITRTVASAEETALIGRKTALQELRQSSRITGVWSNITDEQIDQAEDDPPPPSELIDMGGENEQIAGKDKDQDSTQSVQGAES